MAELVGVFAASHTPVMLNFPGAIPDDDREAIFAAFKSVGDELRRAEPDTVVVISDDHLHNFFLDNFPAFCIGAAASYVTPVEHWLKVDRQTLQGDAALGAHLLGEALQSGFDPSFSMDLTLDHGVLTPLHLASCRCWSTACSRRCRLWPGRCSGVASWARRCAASAAANASRYWPRAASATTSARRAWAR